ncbi:hypothetical protein [Paenarthrobacter histidinolovorans]|uniref:Membrane protein n=1 Tax=Paenarthrobacter histidinolovorans TaxID=43664 RepID=A0ABW8N473_9MICC
MSDIPDRLERLSVPKQMMSDFRTWHVWHHEKAVYREIYTRTISALIVAVIGYFFVALGTSLKLDPIAYLAWTIAGIAVLIIGYTLIARLLRLLKRRITESRARRRGNTQTKVLPNRAKYQRESSRLAVSASVATISALVLALITFLQEFVLQGK